MIDSDFSQPSKLAMPVRSRSPAPSKARSQGGDPLRHNALRPFPQRTKCRQRRVNIPSFESWCCRAGVGVLAALGLAPNQFPTRLASEAETGHSLCPTWCSACAPWSRWSPTAASPSHLPLPRRDPAPVGWPHQRRPLRTGIPRNSHGASTKSGGHRCHGEPLGRSRRSRRRGLERSVDRHVVRHGGGSCARPFESARRS